jgi:hypothetical protein
MSINLDNKVNLIYYFINDNINCYKLNNIKITELDDIRISDSIINTNLIDQLLATGFEKPLPVKQASLEDVFIHLTGNALRDD